MKSNKIFKTTIFALCIVYNAIAQDRKPPVVVPPPSSVTKIAETKPLEPAFEAKTFANDPYNVIQYSLSNGLKVYISINKEQPRIQTYIAVKAGSKNDPADATGLAHYLEHMLFKGTTKLGTSDYAKEKPLLDKIENLYEDYRNTRDTEKRKKIYRMIDSLSGEAAKFSIANEYDRMAALIGCKGTNAHTSFEETVYHNDIPSNQFENWVKLEAERFSDPVLRIFHTELEAVYEEKNRSLDSDINQAFELLLKELFPKHNYGQQTTIGTVEHLKNPSIKRIKEYLNSYYVPNNMAICLSGDINPDEAIRIIDKHFGKLIPKPVPVYNAPVEEPIKNIKKAKISGPEDETLLMAYRMGGAKSADADVLTMLKYMLSNEKAGLLDLNLNMQQKVLYSEAGAYFLNDYGILYLIAQPAQGQTLEQCEAELAGQIAKLKSGDFPDWLPKATITNLKLEMLRNTENNVSRADALVDSYIKDISWNDYINRINRFSKISKEQIVKFANENLKDNYVVVYKNQGEKSNKVEVEKPSITPVETNRDKKSSFAIAFSENKTKELSPLFIDFKSEIETGNVKGAKLHKYTNKTNDVFSLDIIVKYGKAHSKKLPVAVQYLSYCGNEKFSSEDLSKEFFKLGCSYTINVQNKHTTISLTGLEENFEAAFVLLQSLLNNPKTDAKALDNAVKQVLKERESQLLNKYELQNGLLNMALFGKNSVYRNQLTNNEVSNLKASDLTDEIKNLLSFNHEINYYGKKKLESIQKILFDLHRIPEKLNEAKLQVNEQVQNIAENKVYFLNYEMQQAELFTVFPVSNYDTTLFPTVKMHDNYFGSGMGSIVFQTLRESKALAYSTYSRIKWPEDNPEKILSFSYIGTQADKLPEAYKSLISLLDTLPQTNEVFEEVRKGMIQKFNSERIPPRNVLGEYFKSRNMGFDYDSRKTIYRYALQAKLNETSEFHHKTFRNKNYITVLMADKSKLPATDLTSANRLIEIKKEELFGY